MNEESTREPEAPTREGGEDVKFELESPPAQEGKDGGEQLPMAPRQGLLSRIFRRRESAPAGQAAFGELMGVMHSIKNNLELQSNAQARLLDALEHFPGAVDGLKNLGKVGEHQEQMLGLVQKQVEDSAQHGRQVVDSINRFDHTLNLMDETSRNTSETMVGVAERSRESEEVHRVMLERSERRLTYLLGAMGMLTIVVIGGVLFLSVGGGLDARFAGGEPEGDALKPGIEEPVPILDDQEAGELNAEDVDAEESSSGELQIEDPEVDGAEFGGPDGEVDAESAATGLVDAVIVPLDPFEDEISGEVTDMFEDIAPSDPVEGEVPEVIEMFEDPSDPADGEVPEVIDMFEDIAPSDPVEGEVPEPESGSVDDG